MCFDPVREMTAKAFVRYHIAAGSAINARATSGKYLSRRPVVFQVFSERPGTRGFVNRKVWICRGDCQHYSPDNIKQSHSDRYRLI
jgi:hypothetical protein